LQPRALSTVTLAVTFGFIALAVLAQAIVGRLDPIHNVFSEYAASGGTGGAIGTAALALWSLSLLCLAAVATGIGWGDGRTPRRQAVVGFLGIACVGIAIAAMFQTQMVDGRIRAGTDVTVAGRMHEWGAGTAQFAILAAAILSLRDLPRPFRGWAAGAIAAAVFASAATALADADARGLRQRALLLPLWAWQVTLALGARSLAERNAGLAADPEERPPVPSEV
jgi:Protein of unknown function (DUF998)